MNTKASLQLTRDGVSQIGIDKDDVQSFEQLYSSAFQRVYAYHMARTCSVSDAQDLTSQTFIAALEAFETFRADGSRMAWLFGIASRKLVDFYRRRRHELPLDALEDMPLMHPLLVETSEKRERFEKIKQAMNHLVPEQAEALALRIFSALSVAETSQVMGKSEAAIKMLTCRALHTLRTFLSGVVTEDV